MSKRGKLAEIAAGHSCGQEWAPAQEQDYRLIDKILQALETPDETMIEVGTRCLHREMFDPPKEGDTVYGHWVAEPWTAMIRAARAEP